MVKQEKKRKKGKKKEKGSPWARGGGGGARAEGYGSLRTLQGKECECEVPQER